MDFATCLVDVICVALSSTAKHGTLQLTTKSVASCETNVGCHRHSQLGRRKPLRLICRTGDGIVSTKPELVYDVRPSVLVAKEKADSAGSENCNPIATTTQSSPRTPHPHKGKRRRRGDGKRFVRRLAFANAWRSDIAVVERASDQHARDDDEHYSAAGQRSENCGYSNAADDMD